MDWLNWVLVIAALFVLWRVIDGIRNGFVEELDRLVLLTVILGIVALIVVAVGGFINKKVVVVAVAIIFILILCAVYKLLSTPLDVFKKGTKLKALKVIDKILGVVIGVAEGILIVFFAMAVIECVGMLAPGNAFIAWVDDNITKSEILSFVREKNFITDAMSWAIGASKNI